MSTKKHAVKVMIGGEEYTVRSDLETHKAAILAALDITNELFQTKKGEREVVARLAALADDMTKLLPPGKRKALSHQPSVIS